MADGYQNLSLESLQQLHADLVALSESRLSNIERLGSALEDHALAFSALLDKKLPNPQSRAAVEPKAEAQNGNTAGDTERSLELGGNSYKVNNLFLQGAIEVSVALNIDELEAAELFLDAQLESEASGQSAYTCAIIRFHQRRQEVLDCLRLTLELSQDIEREDFDQEWLRAYLSEVVMPQNRRTDDESRFVRRCLSSMGDIRKWLQDLTTRAENIHQEPQTDVSIEKLELLTHQRDSLINQHESLSVIAYYLAKSNSVISDLGLVLEAMRNMSSYDDVLLHCFPILFAYMSHFGGNGQDSNGSIEDAQRINDMIFGTGGQQPVWAIKYVYAAVRVWWLVEYGSWFVDPSGPNSTLEDSKQREQQFLQALKDNAFDFMISLSADVKPQDHYDPARLGLRSWLQHTQPLQGSSFTETFQQILMEQLETFIEGFVTNLPDVLRKLRSEEDEQRQNTPEHDLDLEKFLVMISYTFDDRHKSAYEVFWEVQDGALMGFMHWVSKRASTALVSAFCEMLQAISGNEECATATHMFLLDESSSSSGRASRYSLTWSQITKELTYFTGTLRDRPAAPQTFGPGKSSFDSVEIEPELYMMLECYLRLITKLCTESSTARLFLANHPTFRLSEILFCFVSSSLTPRLKACAFTALRSLLSGKTVEAGRSLWTALDIWISGGFAPGSTMAKAPMPIPVSAHSVDRILKGLSHGFEEPNAFVQLLGSLISPSIDETGLYDSLPFPEDLGAASRMPGIEPYIDFALGDIFGYPIAEIDAQQRLILQISCLNFIATSLDTFNEDLVVFGDRTSIVVDNAIRTSDLKTYVLLHPFTRVMEWMFNERVMNALFAAVHQDHVAVGHSSSSSPLVQCVLLGIHVISRILDLQATYLDIVRPIVRSQARPQLKVVANAAFASFEDGILSHLPVIADLGLYCGAGQPELVIASLELLQKLSASTKLASATVTGMGRLANRNKAIAALEVNNVSDTIAKSLLHEMKNPIDINQGIQHSSYLIQEKILDFLSGCLEASPDHPTIAHLLLGFKCRHNTIYIDAQSSFSQGVSLFHCILETAVLAPIGLDVDAVVTNYLVTIKLKALEVLRHLWKSSLSSSLIMDTMRSVQAIFPMFRSQILITSETLFDGISIENPDLFRTSAGFTLTRFLEKRAITLQYVTAELRMVSQSHLPSLRTNIIATLLGAGAEEEQSTDAGGIFALYDFIELDSPPSADPEWPGWLASVDLSVCRNDYDLPTMNIHKLKQLLLLLRAEFVKANTNKESESTDLQAMNGWIDAILDFYSEDNQIKLYRAARLKLLRSWTQLIVIIIRTCNLTGPDNTSLMLQILQTILPSLESRLENVEESMELALLAKTLIFTLDFSSETLTDGDLGDLVNEGLFRLFQVSLSAITLLGHAPELKEVFYAISYRYLTGMSEISATAKVRRRHSTQTIKAAGERFIDTVCDDANSGEAMCRISALLLLSTFVKMAEKEDSKYVIESISRMNFITILVESIKEIPHDLRVTLPEDVNLHLSYCHARITLLLYISQTRFGATAVLNAGLYYAIQQSGLFTTDPDLGVDFNHPDAVGKHYELLTALMRLFCATILSRGPENVQVLDLGRRFLSENKLYITAVLKKSAGIGANAEMYKKSIDELAETYMLLMSFTGFLDMEEEAPKKSVLLAFT